MNRLCSVVQAIFLLSFSITILISSDCIADTLNVTIDAGEYDIDLADNGTDTITATGFGTNQVPGEPVVPSKVFYIAIPPDADVSNVSFDYNSQFLDGTYNIDAGGLSLPAKAFPQDIYEAAKFEYDANYLATYSSDDPYPAETAKYIGGGGLRKYKLVRVVFSPWQYLPVSGRILFTPQINVAIEYKNSGAIDKSTKLYDKVKEDKAMELLCNYTEARKWYPDAEKPLGSPDYRYIIMCTEATEDAVEVLADWKRSMGIRTKVFTKEDLEADPLYTSYELERKIRYYLRDNYAAWGAEYFLIVGDTDVIPMRECTAGDGGTWEAHTDTYYGELSLTDSASWDDDWDGNYAERTEDSIDWAMELDVGRIPDNNAADVEAICSKIGSFERVTSSWKRRGLFLGAIWNYTNEDGGGGTKSDNAEVMYEMMTDWTWTDWTRHTMYEQAGVDPSVRASTWALTDTNVRNVWDDGQYALVNMAGHGNWYGDYRRIWQWDDGDGIPEWGNGELTDTPFFDNDDISSLNNNYPSIVFISACSCGEWDTWNSLGKALLHTGAVSTISSAGNVQYTHPWNSEADGRIQTFQYLWNKRLINSAQRVGTALMSAKSDFAGSYNWDDGTQQILLNMNLYGDPALLRQGTSLRPNLDYYWPAGWDYIVVPRDTNNGTSTWCPVSSTLPGNSNSTWINYSVENNGNVTTYQVGNHILVDDVYAGWGSWTWLDAGNHAEHNNMFDITVKGGRHTLKVSYDPNDECTESNESDNVYSKQYVWSPYELTNQTPVWRTAPPDRGSGTYYNCDGFQAELVTGEWWCAVGMMPYDSDDDYDIRMYEDYVGSTNGFDTYHVYSIWGSGATDFVIANRNQTGKYTYYPGVTKWAGGDNGFRIQQANSGTGLSTSNLNGPFTINSYDTLDMYEVYLYADTYKFLLDNTSGTADLGMTLYDKDGEYFRKSDYMSGGYANSSGDGGDETFTITITTSGWYGLAVWKTDSDDYYDANTYYLAISTDLDPPTPNPSTWNLEPYPISTTSIGMIANTASDTSGVSYFFDNQYATGTGATDSGWQSLSSYIDYSLEPNEGYGYRVTTRDNSVFNNTGSQSSIEYTSTLIETPTGITFGTVSTNSISARSTNTPSNLNIGGSGLVVYNTTKGTNSGWQHDNDYWSSSGLTPNTSYGFRAKARNAGYVETGYCSTTYKRTLAAIPNAAAFSNITATSIRANWTSNGNPAGTDYYCENLTTGQNSGWTTNTYWVCGGLAPETSYFFRVKARNGALVETSYRTLGWQSTPFLDADVDGLPDSWEQQIIDDNPFDDIEDIWDVDPEDDYDGDDSPNGEEYCTETDPTDDTSFFAIVNITRNPGSTVSVFWQCVDGQLYRILYSDDEFGPGMSWHVAENQVYTSFTGVYEWEDDGSMTGTPPLSVPTQRHYMVMCYGICD